MAHYIFLWEMAFETEVDQMILAHEAFFFLNREIFGNRLYLNFCFNTRHLR